MQEPRTQERPTRSPEVTCVLVHSGEGSTEMTPESQERPVLQWCSDVSQPPSKDGDVTSLLPESISLFLKM